MLDHISLGSFLKGLDGTALEAQVVLHVLSDLTDKALERQLSEEQLGTHLIPTNLADGSRNVSE